MNPPPNTPPLAVERDLAAHHPLTPAQLEFFRANGYMKLKHVLHPETLRYYSAVISEQVRRLNTQHLPMEQRTTYQKAFLQITNIWPQSEAVKPFVFSGKLARLAAELRRCRASVSTTIKPSIKSPAAASPRGTPTNITGR